MITRIRKWGNGLGLRIPKQLARDAHLAEGTSVEIQARSGMLLIRPVRRRQYTLEDLLAGVNRSNLHDESSFGAPAGREA